MLNREGLGAGSFALHRCLQTNLAIPKEKRIHLRLPAAMRNLARRHGAPARPFVSTLNTDTGRLLTDSGWLTPPALPALRSL
jgi:hypothetical protein